MKLQDFASLVGTRDRRTILRWLVMMGIHHTKIGREWIIDKWSFDFRMELAYVESLKQQNPVKWADIFKQKCQDESIVQAVFAIHPPTIIKTQIKRSSNSKHFK